MRSPAPQWLTTVNYYNAKGEVIQSIKDLYPSGTEIASNLHDFTGKVIQSSMYQTIGSSETYGYTKTFSYDKMGRLLNVKQSIQGDTQNGEVTLASYTYDELGQVQNKKNPQPDRNHDLLL